MRVLLIYPAPPRSHWPRGLFRSLWVPTGPAYLAASLARAGHEVRIHVREEHLTKNGFDWDEAEARLRKLLEEFRPEMVGLTVTTPAVAETAEIARRVKETVGEHVLVAVGGPHATALPERTLEECPGVDVAVIGEAEETIVELAEKGPARDVAGLVFRADDSFVRTARRRPPKDLDGLGPRPYELFDMGHYARRNPWMIRWLNLSATNIRTSRGCTNACGFCAGHLVAGLGVRFHSIEYVIGEIERVVNRFGVEAIHFEDDTIGANRARLLDLCEALRRRELHKKVVWECCLRVDQADRELLRQMKSAGCIQVEYGFESGSDECLKRVDKRSSVEMNARAARLTREAGLRIFADVMIGLPGETEADIRSTVRFLRRARPEVISCNRLTPFPGTALYNALAPEVRDSLDWAGYTYLENPPFDLNLTAIPDERFETIYRRLLKYFFRPATDWARLRDMDEENARGRRELRGKIAKFALRHPLRALRLPRCPNRRITP